MKNIIIFGPAGAGKTTVAKMIHESESITKIVSLGAKIKNICRELKYDPEKSDRELQQGVGQGMRGIFGDTVWCEFLWDSFSRRGINLIIDDGRQMSELKFWIDKGFIPVGINADIDTRADRLLARDGYDQRDRLTHETEITAEQIAEDCCRFYIRNDGTLEELQRQVMDLLQEVS